MAEGRVVLLNPPWERPVLRDLYCAVSSKGNYLWPPIDLLVLSGRLKEAFGLTVVDAVAEGLGPERTLERVLAAAPSAVLSLTGSATWRGDVALLSEIKKRAGCLMGVSGDICLDPDPWFMEWHPWLDVMISDFTAPGILDFLASGGEPGEALPGLKHRIGGRVVDGGSWSGPGRSFSYPAPRHELFPLGSYRLPFVREYPFSSILSNFGCPHNCAYCVQSRSGLGYKSRPLEDIAAELDVLRDAGVRELYFRDPLFEASPRAALALCGLLRERFDFSWACNCRSETLTGELLTAMRGAGCRCVAFGFESATEDILRAQGKPITREHARRAVALCRRLGVESAGYFILGLPGETRESALETIRFASGLGLDYASFSAPSPDHGTGLRALALEKGLIDPGYKSFDRSLCGFSMSQKLSTDELNRLLRSAGRRFYFRPSYLLRSLLRLRTRRQAREAFKAAWAVFRRYVLARPGNPREKD